MGSSSLLLLVKIIFVALRKGDYFKEMSKINYKPQL